MALLRKLVLLLLGSAFSAPLMAADVTAEWIGGATGLWTDAANWSSAGAPDDTPTEQYSVFIDNDPGQDSTVTLDTGTSITHLTIDAGDRLDVVGANLVIDSSATGGGTLSTDGSTSVGIFGLLEGLTHTGPGSLINAGGTVRDVTNDSGHLQLGGATWDGLITNDDQLDFVDSIAGIAGSFDAATLAGTGVLTGTGTLNATGAASTLAITGDQTGDGLDLLTDGGTLVIEGTLHATNGSSLNLRSDVTGTGTIDTDASSVVATAALLDGVTHTGAGSLFNLNGTVQDVTNAAGELALGGATWDGVITNDDHLGLVDSAAGAAGSFASAVLAGTGVLTGTGTLNAAGAASTLAITGDQTGDGLNLTTSGGTLVVDGALRATNASSLALHSDVTGAGTLETDTSSVVAVFGLLDGITHTGPGTLFGIGGTVHDVTNAAGELALGGATWDGVITNEDHIDFVDSTAGLAGGFASATLAGTGVLTGTGTLNATGAASTLAITGDQTGDGLGLTTSGGTLVVDGTLHATNASSLALHSDVTGAGTLETDASSVVAVFGLLEGITHTGPGTLFDIGGTVHDVTNAAGELALGGSTWDGVITNEDHIDFVDSLAGAAGSFGSATLAGTGVLTGNGTLNAAAPGSTLAVTGDQTGDGLELLTTGGTLIVDGTLHATNASSFDLRSDITGSGAIDTDATSVVATFGALDGITHTGPGTLFDIGGTVHDVTNAAGELALGGSTWDGLITNEDHIQLVDSTAGAAGSFETATLAGTGVLSGTGTLNASGTASTLAVTGDQTADGLELFTHGGTIVIDGALHATNTSNLSFDSELTGTGVIDTDAGSAAATFGLLEGITHTGAGRLINTNGTVRELTNSGGTLILSDATLDGQITNAATLREASADHLLTVGAGARLTLLDGLVEGDVQVGAAGRLDGTGTVMGDLSIATAGAFSMDHRTGALDVYGDLATDGLLQMELAGTGAAGQYDQIRVFDDPATSPVTGNAVLGGLLDVIFIDGYSPAAGDLFDLITARSIVDGGLTLDFDDTAALSGLAFEHLVRTVDSREVLSLRFFSAPAAGVPGPPTLWLLLPALPALLARRPVRGTFLYR